MAKRDKDKDAAAKPVAQENAVAPQGLGMGGLGDFTAESLVDAVSKPGEDAPKGTATGEDIRDAMGNKRPKLESIVVKHGGVARFAMPDGELEEDFVGVIVAYTYHNSFFGKPFEDREDGERPPCSSNDGATIVRDAEEPQSDSGCALCTKNRAGRDPEIRNAAFDLDRKSACNNYLSLAVALPGQEVPLRLRLSNQSFGAWADYIQRIGTSGRFLPHEVATRFQLKNQNKSGSDFSVLTLEFVGGLPDALRTSFSGQAANYKALLQRTSLDEGGEGGEPTAREAATAARADAAKSADTPAAL